LVVETGAVAAVVTAFVAPSGGTPSKKVVSHLCLVSGRQPARITSAQTNATGPPKVRQRRRRVLVLGDGGCIGPGGGKSKNYFFRNP
jgi:hypothetical protein